MTHTMAVSDSFSVQYLITCFPFRLQTQYVSLQNIQGFLLNFKTRIPSDLPSTSNTTVPRTNKTEKKKSYQKLEAERRERETRDKLSSSFFLHSSPRHSFIISRNKNESQFKNRSLGADTLVDWDRVRMVKIMVPAGQDVDSSISTCSICLDNPVAPRTTKCGHLFCFPCILRQLSSESNSGSSQKLMAKCPCCFHYCAQNDLRPVEIVTVKDIKNGVIDTMTFRKLYRTKDALAPFIPYDVDCTKSYNEVSSMKIHKRIGVEDLPSVTDMDACFSRYNYVDMDLYQSHLQKDIIALEDELSFISLHYSSNLTESTKIACENDKYFITMAIEAVQVELNEAMSMKIEEDQLNLSNKMKQSENICNIIPYSYFTKDWNSNAANDEATTEQNEITMESKYGSFIPGAMYHDDDTFQFYQSVDGQLCFLSGFNLNSLAFEFSGKQSLDDIPPDEWKPPFPDTIEGSVVEVERLHLTTDIRKRMKCFSHLPLYTDITIVELDLNQQLSQRTKEHFKKDIIARHKKRLAKREAEKKAEKDAQRIEDERLSEIRSRFTRIDPNDTFFQSSIGEDIKESDFNESDFLPMQPIVKKKSQQWPNITHAQSHNSEHLSFSSVCASNGRYPSLNSDAAFPSLSSSNQATTASAYASTASNRKGGDKGKKIVLFSTGGRRGF